MHHERRFRQSEAEPQDLSSLAGFENVHGDVLLYDDDSRRTISFPTALFIIVFFVGDKSGVT